VILVSSIKMLLLWPLCERTTFFCGAVSCGFGGLCLMSTTAFWPPGTLIPLAVFRAEATLVGDHGIPSSKPLPSLSIFWASKSVGI
jgi:hypothetical protein